MMARHLSWYTTKCSEPVNAAPDETGSPVLVSRRMIGCKLTLEQPAGGA